MLQDQYHFHVRTRLIHAERDPQPQAFRYLSEFVDDENGPQRLLIIYYAGHGWSKAADDGKIKLSGRHPCDEKEGQEDSIEWVEVERVLSKTKADVLVIFDSCNAGLLCREAHRGQGRCFQYLGACEAKQRTRSAGNSSFTHAMIWALGQLAQESGFPATKLVQVLTSHPNFPKDQHPVLFGSRFEPALENIWIAPMPKPGSLNVNAPPSPPISTAASPRLHPYDAHVTHGVLDLRFHFAQKATKQDIHDVGITLRSLLTPRLTNCHHISFIDHYSYVEYVERVAHRFIERARRRTESRATTPLPQDLARLDQPPSASELGKRLDQLPKLDTAENAAQSGSVDMDVTVAVLGDFGAEETCVPSIVETPADMERPIMLDAGIAGQEMAPSCRPNDALAMPGAWKW